MRASLSRWSFLVIAVCCLVAGTGCKSGMSMPGANWLSWGKKPAPTTLSHSYPQKPSTSVAPSGSGSAVASYGGQQDPYGAQAAARGSYGSPYGQGQVAPAAGTQSYAAAGQAAYGQSAHGQSAHGQSAHGQSAHGQSAYGQSAYGQSAGAGQVAQTQQTPYGGSQPSAAHLQASYGQGANAATGQASYTTAPYQSPYANNGSAKSGSVYTADARNSYGATPGTTARPQGSYPQSSQPGSSAAETNSYPSTGGSSYGTSGGYPKTSANTGTSSSAGLTQSSGPYLPGSTARNGGVLPTAQPATTAGNDAYPTTANSSYGGYPTTSQY